MGSVGNLKDLFIRLRLGRVLGLLFFIAGFLQYRSYHPQFLGLWSYSFTLAVAIATPVLLVLLLRLPRSLLADLALLCWGLAYLLNALDSREHAGDVIDLVFFGSSIPSAALLQWVALVLLFVAVSRTAMAKLDEKWNGLVMLLGAVIGLALVGEGFLRVKTAVVAPTVQGMPTFSLEAWNRRYVKLNREGFRDLEHSIARDPTKKRMLVVGDSFAFGWGIRRLDDRIGEQVASRLANATGQQWEVINASRPNSDTLDEIGYLNQMTKFKPDVVLLIYIFNDIDYLIPSQAKTSLLRNPFVRFFWRNSYLFQELFMRIRVIYYRFRPRARLSGNASTPIGASGELTDAEFAAYANPVLMSRHVADIARFVDIVQQAGAKVLVVPYDMAVTLQPNAQARYKEFLGQTQANSIPMCSLEHTWDGHSFSELTLSPRDGHPNEGSIRMASDAITKCMTADFAGGAQLPLAR